MIYLKAIIAFIGVLCTSLGTAALTGPLTLATILLSVGGAVASSGVVVVVPPKVVRNGNS